ncbi:large ribosomal subunit protein mL37 [Diabrotica undecimpunctata]|uniref:large ribosomal subunit protein mL37 n=1 Tax=Diabrotica undecimpunctata TaxID=50387 RepID=UPI003B6403FA
MRKSPVLLRQHIGWHFYKHWVIQGKRKPLDTGAERILKSKKIPVYDSKDFLIEKREFEKVEVIGFRDRPKPLDETHPEWNEKPLLSYRDNSVLLEGLDQAKIITNTVQLHEGLPDSFEIKNLPKEVDKASKDIIFDSHLFDAEQKKLPKIKNPAKPAWNFPRLYGVTQERRNKLITHRLMKLLESINDRQLVKQRYIFEDLLFSFPFQRNENLIQLELSGDFVLTSEKPLSPITNSATEHLKLPNINPVDPLITLNKENIYKIRDIYPIKPTVRASHPHTVFIYFDRESVKNLYEEEVTENQIFGRSLLKTFAAAGSYARQRYGKDATILKNPVTVQCVQTDGRLFHLGVLQLNTLDLSNTSVKNVWYQTPLQYLFETCRYKSGKPVLEGYNNQIIKQLNCMYNNM